MDANGLFSYNDGTSYQGTWKNDKRDGKGTLIYIDGASYEGEWKEDMMNGRGIYTSAAGN